MKVDLLSQLAQGLASSKVMTEDHNGTMQHNLREVKRQQQGVVPFVAGLNQPAAAAAPVAIQHLCL